MPQKRPDKYDEFGNRFFDDGYLRGIAFGEVHSDEVKDIRERYEKALKDVIENDGSTSSVSWRTDRGEDISITFENVPQGTANSFTVSAENETGIIGSATVTTTGLNKKGEPYTEKTTYPLSRNQLNASYDSVIRKDEKIHALDPKDMKGSAVDSIKKAIKTVEETGEPVDVTFPTKSGAKATFRVVPDAGDGFADGNDKVDFFYKEGTMSERRLTQDEAMKIFDRCSNAKTKADAIKSLAEKAAAVSRSRIALEVARSGIDQAKKSLTVSVGNR